MCLEPGKGETHLSLRVGPEPGEHPRAPQLCHPGVEFVSKDDGEGHALLRLVGGIAEHQALQRGESPLSHTRFRPGRLSSELTLRRAPTSLGCFPHGALALGPVEGMAGSLPPNLLRGETAQIASATPAFHSPRALTSLP